MRPDGNFNPEWGYLAPAPGFMRIARIAVVAAALGAGAGAAAVFSFDRPVADESVAARTLARPTDVASPIPSPVVAEAASPAAAESSTVSTAQRPTSAVALAESPLMPTHEDAIAAPDGGGQQVKAVKKHRRLSWWRTIARGPRPGRGTLAFDPYSNGYYSGRATIGANWPSDPRDDY